MNQLVIDPRGPLAQRLKTAFEESKLEPATVAVRTKVPLSTVQALLGATQPAILPQRIYLRGHLSIVARELSVPVQEAFALFDSELPAAQPVEEEPKPRFSRPTMAIAACLCSIGIIAVILAFFSIR